jgi:hypothetical protein
VKKPDVRERATLVAAYRQGLGLASVAVICGPDGICISPIQCDGKGASAAGETVYQLWWCRGAADAVAVATAALARLHRNASQGVNSGVRACESITRAAKQLNVALRSDREVFDEAMVVVERINCEIETLRNAGGLRPVNKSYQTYRKDAAARGERVVPYARWLRTYTEGLVRKAAATLRYL